MKLLPFAMERWQSTFEHRVRINLSESGVHPMSVGELLEMADVADLSDVRLGYGQSNGSDLLRERVAALYPGATEDSVVVTIGGAEANFAAFWHLMEPGRTAAVMLPNYMQVPGLLENFGADRHAFHLVEADGWQPDLDELRTALDAGAEFILVTHPNNPTGAALSDESMDGIVREAERAGAWILADEVYRGAELGERITPSFWGRYDRLFVTHSLSKAFGLPGLRIGWVLGPPSEMETLWGRTDYTTISPATLSDHLAVAALADGTRDRIRARTRAILNTNLDRMRDWMDAHPGLFRTRPPDAGAICYVHYDAPINSSELAERLRTRHEVLIVPGDHFGMDRYMRLGFGIPEAELLEGLQCVAEELEMALRGVA